MKEDKGAGLFVFARLREKEKRERRFDVSVNAIVHGGGGAAILDSGMTPQEIPSRRVPNAAFEAEEDSPRGSPGATGGAFRVVGGEAGDGGGGR